MAEMRHLLELRECITLRRNVTGDHESGPRVFPQGARDPVPAVLARRASPDDADMVEGGAVGTVGAAEKFLHQPGGAPDLGIGHAGGGQVHADLSQVTDQKASWGKAGKNDAG